MTYLRNHLNMVVLLLLFALALGSSAYSFVINSGDTTTEWLAGWSQNFSTEVFGAIMTFGLFELLVGRQREQKGLKARLLRQIKSKVNAVAIEAIAELREQGWHKGKGSLLVGASLGGANLCDAFLGDTNFSNADLQLSNLSGANIFNSNLSNVNLCQATLSGAYLWDCNLSGANIFNSNLSNANLRRANLSGAFFLNANLSGAYLRNAKFDDKTLLPDAEPVGIDEEGDYIYDKYWAPDTDMTRYTDPNHPDFWQPDWAKQQNTGENPKTNN